MSDGSNSTFHQIKLFLDSTISLTDEHDVMINTTVFYPTLSLVNISHLIVASDCKKAFEFMATPVCDYGSNAG